MSLAEVRDESGGRMASKESSGLMNGIEMHLGAPRTAASRQPFWHIERQLRVDRISFRAKAAVVDSGSHAPAPLIHKVVDGYQIPMRADRLAQRTMAGRLRRSPTFAFGI
jgi:hypothetical protein